MKKKFLLFTMILSTLFLCACSNTSKNADISEITEEYSSEESPTSDLDSLGDIEVDETLFDVTLNIPADLVGETTQDELDKTAEENGYKSITLNEDGSATYVMTKKQHKEMMSGIEESINTSLTEMIGSEDYPNFTDIKSNSDYTEFTITTASTELDMNEAFSVMVFYTYGGMYNIFNGTPVENVHIDFVNADSGEIISSSDSSDMEDSESSPEE